MQKDIVFSILKEKVEVKTDYDKIILRIRFSVSLGLSQFYMDKKMFKYLLKNFDVKEYLIEECNIALNDSKLNIKNSLLKLKETYNKGEEMDFRDVNCAGYGFSLDFNIYNDTFKPITEHHFKRYIK